MSFDEISDAVIARFKAGDIPRHVLRRAPCPSAMTLFADQAMREIGDNEPTDQQLEAIVKGGAELLNRRLRNDPEYDAYMRFVCIELEKIEVRKRLRAGTIRAVGKDANGDTIYEPVHHD